MLSENHFAWFFGVRLVMMWFFQISVLWSIHLHPYLRLICSGSEELFKYNVLIALALTLWIIHYKEMSEKSNLKELAGQVKHTDGALRLWIDGLISSLLYLSTSLFPNISPSVLKPLVKLDKYHLDRPDIGTEVFLHLVVFASHLSSSETL